MARSSEPRSEPSSETSGRGGGGAPLLCVCVRVSVRAAPRVENGPRGWAAVLVGPGKSPQLTPTVSKQPFTQNPEIVLRVHCVSGCGHGQLGLGNRACGRHCLQRDATHGSV